MGDQLRFRCIVVERDKVDLVKYHQSDHELGFYKFYYQLIHHWIFDFNRYSIFLDYKKNKAKDRLHTLKKVLQNANLTSEILCVQALPSKESVLTQLADLLIGAVGYKFHSHLESAAKNSVITKIEDYLKHPIQKTKLVETKFNVFQINLGGGW
jgi:hypothetical protein